MSLLKTEGLTRHFGGLAALNNVSIEIDAHEVVGVIGPNGAGKSTFTNVIAGVYPPSAGRIAYDGQDITSYAAHKRCRLGIGRTFQLTRPLAGLNMLQNIMLGAIFGKKRSLKEAGKISQGLCEFLKLGNTERPVSELTALEVKKMEIARALAAEPKLLFLDEVMAGLNKEETMEMIQTVRDIHGQGMTIIIIEHIMRVIRELTHRVIVLEWGTVLTEGPYEQVSGDPRVITAYLGEEAE